MPKSSSDKEPAEVQGRTIEDKRAEAALRETEERFRMLADNMSQLAWTCDLLGNVTWYNKRWLDYTGLSFEDMQGWGWTKVQHPDHVDRVVARVRHSGETGEPWEDTFPLRGKDGEYRWFLSRALPIRDEQGNLVQWFGTNTDVTAQKMAEEQVARQAQELRALNERLQELDRAKTTFFSNVSHEFRTPLSLILGPTEEILSGALGETNEIQREHLTTLRRNAARLQKLVNTLLDFARVESGRAEASYEPVDIGLLTRDLASTFCSAVHRAGLLYVVGCPSVEEPVYIDRDMWEKIVLNLLSNALKFTFEGAIEVSLKAEDDHVELTVRDTGVGIPAEELPHLFDRFHRIRGSRARTEEGSGIGLALVHELVKLHGGSVQAESSPGVGTAFTISIPKGFAHLPQERLDAPRTLSSTALGAAPFVEEVLRWLPDSEPEAAPLSMELAESFDAPRPIVPSSERILIADDNLDMRDYLKRLLETRWNVTVVENGAQALEIARAEQPDLVLSDVVMPGLDGFELLRELRADERTSTIPVILLSAWAGEEPKMEGLNAGADDYLVKPFTVKELLARVEAHLKLHAVRREAQQALRESEERYRRLVGLLPVAVYTCEAPSGIITFCNEGAAELWGRAPEIGDDDERFCGSLRLYRSDGSLLPHDETPMAAAVRQGRQCRNQEVFIERPDGTRISVLVNIDPIRDETGRLVGAINVFHDTTALKEAERERSAAEEIKSRLAAIVESSDDAIISKDLNGVIMSWNQGAERIFGYTAAEAVGQPVSMLIPADRLDEEPNILQRIRSGQRIDHYETVRRRKDGTLLDISLTVSPIVDAHGRVVGASKIARDITERKQVDHKLRESETRFRLMADSSPIMIWMTDGEGHTSFRNRTYLEYFGVNAEEAPAFDWSGIVHPDDRDAYVAAFETALQKRQTFHHRVRLRRFDGRWRWFEARGNPIFDDAGNMVGFIGSSLDITDIYESQQALKELGQRKDEFLANMSHEIRSPLTGIMGFADILLAKLKAPEDIECLRTIKESGDYLIEIVNDILDLSKIEAGKLVLNIEPVSVHGVMAEVQTLMDVRARQKRLPLSLRYEGLLPGSIQTDRTRLRQILINLVSNAIKFTEQGKVEIVVRFLTNDSLLTNGGDYSRVGKPASNRRTEMSALQVEVIDTGVGIAPEHQEILFQPFTQADTTSTRQYGGTGLGLTITRRLVEMLGGSVSFESELDKGSTFRVIIPAAPMGTAPKAIDPRPRTGAIEDIRLRDRRVLVVDDREEICYLVSRYVKEAGGRPTAASNGEAAIEAIRSAQEIDPFDAMILDIHMPDIDGYDVARKLRANGFHTPIIALTAGAMVGDREKCLAAGCDDYLTKPIDRQKLVELVAHHVQKVKPLGSRYGGPLRVLLVDDSHNACKLLSGVLEKRGHEVRSAYDGESAVSIARDFNPEVILLDIRLPDMDGFQLMQRLKELNGINAQFIGLSGYRDNKARGLEEFDHFLEKPVDVFQLQMLLNSRYG